MALKDDVEQATLNDTIMWCHKEVDGEQIYYSRIPYGHLVFIPSTNTIKLWSARTDEVGTAVHDISQEIADNVSRHTSLASETKDK